MTSNDLEAAAHARNEALEQLADADAALHALVQEALQAGTPKTEVARRAGLSRQTIYNLIGRSDAPEKHAGIL